MLRTLRTLLSLNENIVRAGASAEFFCAGVSCSLSYLLPQRTHCLFNDIVFLENISISLSLLWTSTLANMFIEEINDNSFRSLWDALFSNDDHHRIQPSISVSPMSIVNERWRNGAKLMSLDEECHTILIFEQFIVNSCVSIKGSSNAFAHEASEWIDIVSREQSSFPSIGNQQTMPIEREKERTPTASSTLTRE